MVVVNHTYIPLLEEAQKPRYPSMRGLGPQSRSDYSMWDLKPNYLSTCTLKPCGSLDIHTYPYNFINPFPKNQVFGCLHHLDQLSSKGIQAFLLHRSGACLCTARVAPAPAAHLGNNAEEARITLGIQTAQCR